MNSNEMYIIKQPEKAILSVIIMDTSFPLSKISHNYLERLQRISDTCFLFNDQLYPSRLVNKRKFTTLYEGNSFMKCEGDSILPQIVKTFEYFIEIYNKHISFILFNLSDLEKYREEEFDEFLENLMKVNMSGIERPILEILRLDNEDLFNYYKVSSFEPKEEEDCIGSGLFNEILFAGSVLSRKLGTYISYIAQKNNDEDRTNIYATWKTISRVQFFRAATIKVFIEYCKKFPDFLNTFTGNRIDQVFASLLRRLRIKTHDSNIETLKLGDSKITSDDE